jgi:hypothetical protein
MALSIASSRAFIDGQRSRGCGCIPRRRIAQQIARPAAAPRRRQDPVGELLGQEPVLVDELERMAPVQELVERHAVAELIAGRGAPAAVQLRRHVRRRSRCLEPAVGLARGGQRARAPGGLDLGRQPEVEHSHISACGDEHVVRLEIAVHHVVSVGGSETAPGGQTQAQHVPDAVPLFARLVAQGPAVEELHGEEHPPAEGTDVIDGDHVRMRQTGDRLGLLEQHCLAAPVILAAAPRPHHLDGDPAVEARIVAGKDPPHRSLAQLVDEKVGPHPGARQRILEIDHIPGVLGGATAARSASVCREAQHHGLPLRLEEA